MINYAKQIAKDRNDQPIVPSHIPTSTLGSVYRTNASESSVTSLTDDTSAIEVSAITTSATIRWAINQATSVTTANFDNVVPLNSTRLFVVPKRTIGLGAGSVAGVNSGEGLFSAVATISVGVGSVFLAQY